jgi:hypothetical protein
MLSGKATAENAAAQRRAWTASGRRIGEALVSLASWRNNEEGRCKRFGQSCPKTMIVASFLIEVDS